VRHTGSSAVRKNEADPGIGRQQTQPADLVIVIDSNCRGLGVLAAHHWMLRQIGTDRFQPVGLPIRNPGSPTGRHAELVNCEFRTSVIVCVALVVSGGVDLPDQLGSVGSCALYVDPFHYNFRLMRP